jgi:hypothetical protein
MDKQIKRHASSIKSLWAVSWPVREFFANRWRFRDKAVKNATRSEIDIRQELLPVFMCKTTGSTRALQTGYASCAKPTVRGSSRSGGYHNEERSGDQRRRTRSHTPRSFENSRKPLKVR